MSSPPEAPSESIASVERRGAPHRLALAGSLQAARRNELVYVNRDGSIRSPARVKLSKAAMLGVIGLGIPGLPVLYGLLLGPAGAVFAGGVSLWSSWRLYQRHKTQLAARYIVDERYDEALEECQRLLRRPLVPKSCRAAAMFNIASIYRRQARFQDALEHYQKAQSLATGASNHIMGHLAHYGRVFCLVELARLSDARALVEQSQDNSRAGEYLQATQWTAELYVCFAEGSHAIAEDDLHERVRFALGLNTSAPLLALLSWAHEVLADTEQAEHLMRECIDRLDQADIATQLPRMHQWMQERGVLDRLAADPYDDL